MSRPEIVEDVIAGQLAADVAAERRASGVTVAPEAALHRALQARTDELERVRESARAESLMLRRRVSEMEDENEDNRRRRAQAVETMEHREAEREVIEAGLRQQIDTLTRERDTARAERDAAVRDRDEALARWDAYERVLLAEISPTPDGDAPTMTITATDPEDAARRVREYVSAYAPPTAPDVVLSCAPAAGAADPLRLSGTSRPPATWWPASDTRTPVACDISPGADNCDTQALLRRRHGE